MGHLKGTSPICPINQHCSEWARVYLKYCLCSVKDGAALTLGLVSVLSWGVAEVPQIITNYKEKSTEGLSIGFLLTWIVGDLFNLAGCLLEPATLPTQFYMALLYTATTMVLTGQTIYYGHIYLRLKATKTSIFHKSQKYHEEERLKKEKHLHIINEDGDRINDYQVNGHRPAEKGLSLASRPIPVSATVAHHQGSAGRDLYYMSARSLTKSPVPKAGIWLGHSRDFSRTPPAVSHDHCSSREPLLGSLAPTKSAPSVITKNMLSVVSFSVFLVCNFAFQLPMDNSVKDSPRGMVIMVGRKLLQTRVDEPSIGHSDASSEIGSYLGWAMAAIYMGGRLPQIYLNIRRGHVEGLSPLMFLFALIGNATYVGSILVNSVDWSQIRPNMPWIVDAGGCIILDTFILIQFAYFRYRKNCDVENQDDSGDI